MRKLKVPLEKRLAALNDIAKGKSPYDVAKELKVTPQAVYRWLAVAKNPRAVDQAGLVRRIERLETDLDFLKKDLLDLKERLPKKR